MRFAELETLSVPCFSIATLYEQSRFELIETSRFVLTRLSFFLSQKKTTAKLTESAYQWNAKYLDHYHRRRNHQGRGNLRIEPPPDEPVAGDIICDEELGGLLNYYRRKAA